MIARDISYECVSITINVFIVIHFQDDLKLNQFLDLYKNIIFKGQHLDIS